MSSSKIRQRQRKHNQLKNNRVKKLHPVKLNKTDTCLTYVKKRIGNFNQKIEYSLSDIGSLFNTQVVNETTIFEVGDIILWSNKSYLKEYPIEITEEGHIISHMVQRNIHVAIVEFVDNSNNIRFSECMRTDKINGSIPIIQFRSLSEQRLPDFILTENKNK